MKFEDNIKSAPRKENAQEMKNELMKRKKTIQTLNSNLKT